MNRIGELRKMKKMNQDELASLLNVQRAAISKYETEKVPLTTDTLKKLSDIFNVSTDYIIGLTDEPTRYIPMERSVELNSNGYVKGEVKDSNKSNAIYVNNDTFCEDDIDADLKDLKFAFYEEYDELTEEHKRDLRRMMDIMKQAQKKS